MLESKNIQESHFPIPFNRERDVHFYFTEKDVHFTIKCFILMPARHKRNLLA